MEKVLEIAKENFLNKEKYLSEYACKSSDYIRLNEDMVSIDVARHPDSIYFIKLDTNVSICEYSMLRLIKKNNESR